MIVWLLNRIPIIVLVLLIGGAAAVSARSVKVKSDEADTIVPLRPLEKLDERKVMLGQKLFVDPIMSGKGKFACNSCHDLKTNGSVNMKRTVGYAGQVHRFNSPTIFNVANNYRLGWRGNFTSLAAQNEQILLDKGIMANNWKDLVQRLRSKPIYNRDFLSIYGQEPEKDNILDVLVEFQKSLVTPDAPFDSYLKGNPQAITEVEKRGYRLFREYGCSSCHQGTNIGGNLFQKFGIFEAPPANDLTNDGNSGRFSITHNVEDISYFRVPSLRNVAITGPYFHDGRTEMLDDAVRVMAKTQVGQEIPTQDVEAIVQFLGTLTGRYKGVPLRKNSTHQVEMKPEKTK